MTHEDPIARFARQQGEFRESVRSFYGARGATEHQIGHALSGSLKLVDAVRLAETIKSARPERILEVGSFLGFSTRVILEASEEFAGDVVSVDPRVRHRMFDDIGEHLRSFNPSPRLEMIDGWFAGADTHAPLQDYLDHEPRMDEASARRHLDSIPVISEPFDRFDFFFIDGDHSFFATARTLRLALRMAQPGSILVVHDVLSWPAVLPAAELVAKRITGVEIESVAGRFEQDYFRDRWSRLHGIDRLSEPSLNRLVNTMADGLVTLRVSDDVDVDQLRVDCKALTKSVIGEARDRFRAGQPPPPKHSPMHRGLRRAREAAADPRWAAATVGYRVRQRLRNRKDGAQ